MTTTNETNVVIATATESETTSTSTSIGTRNNTCWSLEPDPEPDYSDWTIILEWKGNKKNRDFFEPINKKQKTSNENNEKEKNINDQRQRWKFPPKSSYRYFVHRNLVGPKSKYFSHLFLSRTQYSESNRNESCIQFSEQMDEKTYHAVAGEAFQIILNHCYLNEDSTRNQGHEETAAAATTTTNSTLLLSNKAPGLDEMNAPIVICLCDYFQIDSLSKIAKQLFMRDRRKDILTNKQREENVHVDDLIHIYECAKDLRCDFNVDDLESYVIDECLDDPSQLLFGKNKNNSSNNNTGNHDDHNKTVADVADLRLWRILFTEYYKLRKKYFYSEKLVKEFSLALVFYLEEFEKLRQQQNRNHADDNVNNTHGSGVLEVLDGVTFQQLTDVSAFSVVSEHAALALLRFEEFYNNDSLGDNDNDDDDDDGNGKNRNNRQQQQLTNLQERCVDALDKSPWRVLKEQQPNQEEDDDDDDDDEAEDGTKNGKLVDAATLRKKLGNLNCTSLILQSLLTKSVDRQQKSENQTSILESSVEHLQKQLANLRRRNRELRTREYGNHTRSEEEKSTAVTAENTNANGNGNVPVASNNQPARRSPFREEELFSRRRQQPLRAEINVLGEYV